MSFKMCPKVGRLKQTQAKLLSLKQSAKNSRTFFKKWKTLFEFKLFKLKLLLFLYVYGKKISSKMCPKVGSLT